MGILIIAILAIVSTGFIMKSVRISNSINYIKNEYGLDTEFVREKK